MKRALLSIFVILLTIHTTFAQDIDEDYLSILLQEEDENSNLAFKPVIGLGMGCFSFFGDVNDYYRTPINGLTSYRISISRNISKYFDIEFHGTFGNINGSSYNGSVNDTLNFRTQLFTGGVSLAYNFNHILERKRPIHPYISLGVEIFQFSPKGDWKDADGNDYHYWTDGTIRDVEQRNGENGHIITRDNVYETDLRKLNLYGYGEYSKTSFSIPVDMGLNITVSDRITCRVGAAFHFPMTDYVDNYKGGGLWKNDVVLNTYVSLSFDLFSPADEIAAVETFRNLKFTITDQQDEDGDRVDDFNDECPGTPANVKVTYKGCPEDKDKDGVPDYMDKQNDTPLGKIIVGSNGIKMTDAQVISLLYDPNAVKRSEVKIYSQTTEAKSNATGKKEIPAKFKSVDTNEDRYVSHEELQKAIDAIFEGSSTLTPADINELQDFFFDQ
jgi:hypothetical protein